MMATEIILRLPHLCHKGHVDEVWLLKHLGDLHWQKCQNGDVYQSFIYVELGLPLERYKDKCKMTIQQEVEDLGSICTSEFDIDGYYCKLISAPVRIKDNKLQSARSGKIDCDELRYRRSKRERLKYYQSHYITNLYRDFNGVGIMYFANYVRIENEFFGPAVNGRVSCYYKNVDPNSELEIFYEGNEISFTKHGKTIYHSLRPETETGRTLSFS